MTFPALSSRALQWLCQQGLAHGGPFGPSEMSLLAFYSQIIAAISLSVAIWVFLVLPPLLFVPFICFPHVFNLHPQKE